MPLFCFLVNGFNSLWLLGLWKQRKTVLLDVKTQVLQELHVLRGNGGGDSG